MRFFVPLPVLIVLVIAYPHGIEKYDKTIVSAEYYPENLVVYEGEHDIVDIVVPLNRASMYDSFESHSSGLSYSKDHLMVFFIEADMKDGHREDHGIHMYRNGKTVKIIDKGTAIAASADDSDYVFIGAKDGLYVFNPVTQKADKYGTFNSSIKDIAKEQKTDVIYILTGDRELYKVYDVATKKVKINDVKQAEQIMIDYSNNLYYYDEDKMIYVRTVDGEIKEIDDLPIVFQEVRLFRPPMFNNEGVGLMVDNELYTIYPDGRSESENLEFMPDAKPTAYSMETGIFRYFGYKKKIYEYDLLSMIDSSDSSDSTSYSYLLHTIPLGQYRLGHRYAGF